MVRRLDLAEAEDVRLGLQRVASEDAPLQLVWTALGVALFCAVLLLVRDHTRLARYSYTAAALGLVLLLLPNLPVLGRTINGARLWVRVGPGPGAAQRGRQARAHGLLRQLPRRQARRPVAGRRAGSPASTCRAAATSARSCSPGRRACPCSSSSTTSAARCCSSASSSRCSTSPPSARPGCSSASACSPAAPTSPTCCSATCGCASTSGCTRSATRTTRATSWCSRCSASARAGSPAPGSARAARTRCPFAKTDFILASFGEELGPGRRHGDPRAVRAGRASAACGPAWAAATPSASCSPPACRSRSPCRSSSSSAASPGSSR